jgi:signal peptidase II
MKAAGTPRLLLVFFGLMAAGFALDVWTKRLAFQELDYDLDGRVYWLWPGVFGFQTSLNDGALFGFFQGGRPIFVCLSVAALIGILVWMFRGGGYRDRILAPAFGLISAGILGNLFDRLGLPGLIWKSEGRFHNPGDPVYAVRDWVLMVFWGHTWPNYNVADSLLVVGAILLAWHVLRSERTDASPPQASTPV